MKRILISLGLFALLPGCRVFDQQVAAHLEITNYQTFERDRPIFSLRSPAKRTTYMPLYCASRQTMQRRPYQRSSPDQVSAYYMMQAKLAASRGGNRLATP